MKIVCIIQARMGSKRLPGKIMKKINDISILEHVIRRVKKSKLIDEIVIATTDLSKDDIVSEHAKELNVGVFRGNEDDVLSRYYYAAKEYNADLIIRITSDCPLIDPYIIDECIDSYNLMEPNILTNAGGQNRTFPRGLDTEVFSFKELEHAFKNAKKDFEREHVTTYIYDNAKSIYYYKNKEDMSNIRVTVDTKEDFELVNTIYKHFGNEEFFLAEIKELFLKEPQLYKVNSSISQKYGEWENVYK